MHRADFYRRWVN